MDNKKIAHKLLEVVGGTPKVVEYVNEDSKIDIYIGENRPYEGVTSYGTIGLSNYDIGLEVPNKKALRVEFIGACGNYYKEFANIISSCAFNIVTGQYSCNPGVVYPDIINQYYEESEMKHIMFAAPFLWDNLSTIEFDTTVVTWLMPIPISDSEFEFVKEHGSEALEELFEEHDIDVFDLERKSVV